MSDNKKNNNNDYFKQKRKENTPKSSGPMKDNKQPSGRFNLAVIGIILLVVVLIGNWASGNSQRYEDIPLSTFKVKILSGEIKSVSFKEGKIMGYTRNRHEVKEQVTANRNAVLRGMTGYRQLQEETQSAPTYRSVTLVLAGMQDPELLSMIEERQLELEVFPPSNNFFMNQILPMLIIFVVMIILFRTMFKRIGAGPNALNFGQNKGRIIAEQDLKTTFADVAGCDEAKLELEEIVDFLKNPARYTEIGGKIPKGALLVGPPGTGKTLLARAVAGESGVTFFKMSGSDFVEMFVGVGAARVRDLFQQARQKAPCIIFIDEMDTIGKSRNNSLTSNDEREQTLNQLLVEMDGFDSTTGVIILAATNRPQILDPALLRPGRFDRQVSVDRPDMKGREQILKIHTKNIKMDETVNLKKVASGTPGFVGADLANVANEAALMAVRAGRNKVSHIDFDEAIEKHAMGVAKKSRSMLRYEKETTAYHEIGHALLTVLSPSTTQLRKITIVPRGWSLGATWSSPQEGRYSQTTEEFIAEIDILLAGRAAEKIIFGKITTGAGNDIQRATAIAREMIMDHGMSDRFLNVSFGKTGYDKQYSESTQEYIDHEIARIINGRYEHVLATLKRHQSLLRELSIKILETESMSDDEFFAIFNQNEQAKAEREAMLAAHPHLIEKTEDSAESDNMKDNAATLESAQEIVNKNDETPNSSLKGDDDAKND